ncbi:Hpt domain-containing protein [Rhodopirellula sp. P2]|uniref:Hpt domain-containing protein n=1 Tax=Rhodopirellula sp. P2 TaxID=2127060 RepID=UPI002367AF0C|nr:Hpt domain-containing protein [Rhodopirellula sp. P2]WDQ15401.1 Hpt domain-containing protein [Rhodopirellula sp. P2]
MPSSDRIDVPTAPPSALGYYRLNEMGRMIEANETLLRILAIESINDLQAKGDDSTKSPRQVVPWHSPSSRNGRMFREYFDRNLPITQCQSKVRVAGQTRWFVETLIPVRNGTGHLEQWLGTVHDVTASHSQSEAMLATANATAAAREAQLIELCDQVRWSLGRVRESIRASDSACMTNALCDTIEHLVDLESESDSTLDADDVVDPGKQAVRERRQGFRLCELVEDLAESVAPEIHRAGRRITVQIDHGLPTVVRGNLQTIHCVLANLLHHAASHTDWGDVKIVVAKSNSRAVFAIRMAGHPWTPEETAAEQFDPEHFPSEWKIASRYAQRLHSGLTPRFLPSGCLEVSFETTLVEDTDLQSDQHPETVLGEHTRVLIVTAHTATRDALTEILAGWKIASSNCDELDVALQRIRINEKMGQKFDAILIDEAIFATRQSLSKETMELLATSANIRIQSRGTKCQSSFQQRLRTPDWVWTVSEPIRQGCLRTAMIGAIHSDAPSSSNSCEQCHSLPLHDIVVKEERSVFPIERLVTANADDDGGGTSSSNTELLEASMLLGLDALQDECGGDPALSAVVMEVMCASMPKRIDEIHSAVQRGDLDSVQRLAHQMSGAAKDHSLTAVAELTTELKAHAISRDSRRVNACVDALADRVTQTIELMQSLLEETS